MRHVTKGDEMSNMQTINQMSTLDAREASNDAEADAAITTASTTGEPIIVQYEPFPPDDVAEDDTPIVYIN